MAEKNKKQTPFEAERERIINRIFEYKRNAESNIIAAIYKQPDLIFEDNNLSVDSFDDDCCRVYFAIAYGVLVSERKKTLDSGTVNFYLDKHPKLKSKYEEYGAWEEAEAGSKYVITENFDAYIMELRKWQAVLELAKQGFPVEDKLSRFADVSVEDIYDEFEYVISSIFANKVEGIKQYNIFDNIGEYIREMDSGISCGIPFYGAELLTNETCGFNYDGNIYGLGAGSGVGKSTMAFNYLFPSAMATNQRVVFIINEEDQRKFQLELVIWVANNIYKADFQKQVFRRGGFLENHSELMSKCEAWIDERKKAGYVIVIPLERYTVNTAKKIINKYASFGVKIFVLDTLKESADAKTDEIFKSMMRDMVALYDVVKPTARNVGLFVTYQLGKGSLKMRHLTNNEIGQAKSILDVMSVNFMMRRPYDDEYKGEPRALKCWREEGKGTLVNFELERGKSYMITFVLKNRFGNTDVRQIVSECDLSTNTYKDIGFCNVPLDW